MSPSPVVRSNGGAVYTVCGGLVLTRSALAGATGRQQPADSGLGEVGRGILPVRGGELGGQLAGHGSAAAARTR